MATELDTSLFSKHERLLAEYRACAINCRASLDQLRAAERELRAVAAEIGKDGEYEISLEIEKALGCNLGHNEALDGTIIEHLSTRERQVFELIGAGLSTPQIAAQLQIAPSTVETYRERLKDKLHLSSGLELIRFAVLWIVNNGASCRGFVLRPRRACTNPPKTLCEPRPRVFPDGAQLDDETDKCEKSAETRRSPSAGGLCHGST